MSAPEKYFINQIRSHLCQLPPSDDFESMKKVKKLQNYFLISENSLLSYLKAKSISAIYYEKRRQLRTTPFVVIHPYSEFFRNWQIWTCSVIVVSLIVLPFSAAFHGAFYARYVCRDHHSLFTFYFILIVSFIIRLFCLVDVFINFRLGYVSSSTEEIVIHPARIARHYLCTFFAVDLLSAIPVDCFWVWSRGVESYASMNVVTYIILSSLHLLKLTRLGSLYNYAYNIFNCFSVSHSVYKMVASIFLYFMLIHWFACFCTFIPRAVHYNQLLHCNTSPCNTSWVFKIGIVNKGIFDQYVASAYRSLTCLVGVGVEVNKLRNAEDKILLIIVGVVGKVYWIFTLVIFLQMISSIRSGKTKYLEMMDQVNYFMKHKKLPKRLQKRIKEYYIYLFQREYIGENKILRLMSDNLKQEMLLSMHQNLTEKVYMFSGLNEGFLFSIINCLKSEIYLTEDVIFKTGDVGESLYFISFGTVAIYGESGKEVGHLEDGEYFGDVSLILRIRRPATVVAIEPTEVYKMEARDFFKIIKPHTTVYLKMEKIAIERYKKCQDLTNENKKQDYSLKKTFVNNTEDEEDEDDEEDEEAYNEESN